MMVTCEIQDHVAVVTIDDGKVNAVSHTFLDAMSDALNAAEADAKAVLIRGRDGMFSAGFDLKEFKKGPVATQALVTKGAAMMLRLFTHPQPLVVACTGHAVAAGAFILLACDTRLGAKGDFKIGLNETAIGFTLPVFGFELAKARLSKRHLTDAVVQARLYSPVEARDAGFLDSVHFPEVLQAVALDTAKQLGALPGDAYTNNKRGVRADVAARIKASLR